MLVQQLLWGVVLPALVAVAVLVAACRPRRSLGGGPGAWGGATAMGAGYITGHLALFGWPGLAPKESWEWLPLVAAATTVAGMLLASARVPRRVAWGMAGLVAVAAAWLLVPQWQESRQVWAAALAIAAIGLWAALHALAERTSIVSPSLIVFITASAAALVFERAATARFAQLAAALAAPAGGCVLVAALRSGVKLGPGLAGPGAVLLVALMFTGQFNHFSDVPAVCFFLVAAAPPMAWMGQLEPIRRRRTWQRMVFEAAAVLLPVAVALGLAWGNGVHDSLRGAVGG